MNHAVIVTHRSQITAPSVVIYSLTVQDVIQQIVCRMGEDVLTLSAEELKLSQQVTAAIAHNLDIREYINMGLDVWEISRKL